MSDRKELWLPTSTMHVTVENGEVRIVESMTMEKRKVKEPAGIGYSPRPEFFKQEQQP